MAESKSKPKRSTKILDEIALLLDVAGAFTVDVHTVNPNVSYRDVGVYEVCDDGLVVENDNGGRALVARENIVSVEVHQG